MNNFRDIVEYKIGDEVWARTNVKEPRYCKVRIVGIKKNNQKMDKINISQKLIVKTQEDYNGITLDNLPIIYFDPLNERDQEYYNADCALAFCKISSEIEGAFPREDSFLKGDPSAKL